MDPQHPLPIALQNFLPLQHHTSQIHSTTTLSHPETSITIDKPTPLFPPACFPRRSSPPISISLKTRESSAMALQHIFDQINSGAERFGQAFDPRLRQAMRWPERKDEEDTHGGLGICGDEAEQLSVDKPSAESQKIDVPQPSSEPHKTVHVLEQTKGTRCHWNHTQEVGELLSLGSLVETKADDESKRGEARNGRSSSLLSLSDEIPNSFETSPLRRSDKLAGIQSLNHSRTHVTEFELSSQMDQTQRPSGSGSFSQQVAFGPPISMPRLRRSVSGQQDALPLHPTLAHLPILPLGDGAQSQSAAGVSRPHATAKQPIAQLTIFYNGMVNVYDSIPADKAHAIMLLAGSGSPWASNVCRDTPSNNWKHTPVTSGAGTTSTMRSVMAHATSSPLSGPTFTFAPSAPTPSFSVATEIKQQQSHRRSHTSDLPVARKASLARFLERRRDRVQTKVCNKEMEDLSNKDEVGSLQSDMPSSPKRRCLRSRSPSPSPSPSPSLVATQ